MCVLDPFAEGCRGFLADDHCMLTDLQIERYQDLHLLDSAEPFDVVYVDDVLAVGAEEGKRTELFFHGR